MKISAAFPSNYLKCDDLSGQPRGVTIRTCVSEELGQGRDKEKKPVLYFSKGTKGLVLNITNANCVHEITLEFNLRRIDLDRLAGPVAGVVTVCFGDHTGVRNVQHQALVALVEVYRTGFFSLSLPWPSSSDTHVRTLTMRGCPPRSSHLR